MEKFLKAQPFGILGALSILGMLKGALEIDQAILGVVEAWQTLTRPLAEFLFGRLAEMLSVSLPNLIKDYLSLSVVFASGSSFARIKAEKYRVNIREMGGRFSLIVSIFLRFFISIIIWPAELIVNLYNYYNNPSRGRVFDPDKDRGIHKSNAIWSENYWKRQYTLAFTPLFSLLWVAVFICVSYSLIFGRHFF